MPHPEYPAHHCWTPPAALFSAVYLPAEIQLYHEHLGERRLPSPRCRMSAHEGIEGKLPASVGPDKELRHILPKHRHLQLHIVLWVQSGLASPKPEALPGLFPPRVALGWPEALRRPSVAQTPGGQGGTPCRRAKPKAWLEIEFPRKSSRACERSGRKVPYTSRQPTTTTKLSPDRSRKRTTRFKTGLLPYWYQTSCPTLKTRNRTRNSSCDFTLERSHCGFAGESKYLLLGPCRSTTKPVCLQTYLLGQSNALEASRSKG